MKFKKLNEQLEELFNKIEKDIVERVGQGDDEALDREWLEALEYTSAKVNSYLDIAKDCND